LTVKGNFGATNVTIGNVTVPDYLLAVAEQTVLNPGEIGAGDIDGILGLGLPGLTARKDVAKGSRAPYDTLPTAMQKSGLTSSSVFSLALQRHNGGYLAFGGLPPVKYNNTWGKAPVVKQPALEKTPVHGYWALVPDAFTLNGSSIAQNEAYIIDSGTTEIQVPGPLAKKINAMFQPPSPDGISVSCTAIPPDVGITIGGVTFKIDPIDLIIELGNDMCTSSIQESAKGRVIGNVFLTNVVAVFDAPALQMRFATNLY